MRRNGRKVLVFFLVSIVLLFGGFLAWCESIAPNTEDEIVEAGFSWKHESLTLVQSLFYEEEGSVNTSVVGEYPITYKFKFSPEVKVKTVTVVDTMAPVFTIIGDTKFNLSSVEEFIEPGMLAVDLCDGVVEFKTEIVKNAPNSYEVVYTAEDKAGNISTISRYLHVVRGTVCLTFDDGPSLETTPKILDILDEKGVTATFFVVGFEGDELSNIVQREVQSGHTVGLHGMSHKYSEIYTDVDTLMENFYQLDELIKGITNGYSSSIIRFPGGSSNTVSKNYCKGIMTEASKRVTEEGYIYFDWNVDSEDAGGVTSAYELYQNVISNIKANRTNVVLMHDTKQFTVEALPDIIDWLLENDYQLMPITDETVVVHHNISN